MTNPSHSSASNAAKWLGILIVLFAASGLAYWSSVPALEEPASEPGVLLFRYNQRSASTELREQGFLDTMEREFPSIRILSKSQYLGSTRSSAVKRSRHLIDKFGDAVTGVFCVNESTAAGCLQTLQEVKRSRTVPLVGFDVTPAMIAAVRRDEMAGFVVQDPKKMGYQAVNAALAHLRGESVDDKVFTDHVLVTAENLDSDSVRPLIYPERFSGKPFVPEKVECTLGFVTRGIAHDYWQSVRAGVEKAAKELGNTLIRFEAPAIEDDVNGQIEIVQQMIADKFDAICLAPIDSTALGKVVLEATDAGVPVVLFDSGLDAKKASQAAKAAVCYVATDNYEAGATAARHLAAVLKAQHSSN